MTHKFLTGVLPRILVVSLMAAASAVLMAQPPEGMMRGDGQGYGMGSGMGTMGGGMGMMDMGGGMGSGMMMGGGMGPLHMLDLTDDQRTQISKIHDEHRKKNWDTMGKIMDEQAKLRDLYNAETPDPKKIGAAYGGMAKLQQQMIESHVESMNRMQALLTQEQKNQLKQWHRGMGGAGAGSRGPASGSRGQMGPGSMPGGMMGR